MESKFKQYIVTDSKNLGPRLSALLTKMQPELLGLQDFFDYPEIRDSPQFVNIVFYINDTSLEAENRRIREQLRLNPLILGRFILNADLGYEGFKKTEIEDDLIFGILPENTTDLHLSKSFANAFLHLQMITDQFDLLHKINTAKYEINRLTRIGISLANEKDFDKLLREILYSAREISNADSGSLYLVEQDDIGFIKNLRFKISALSIDSEEFILPINKSSIAGYVAETGKVLNIPDVHNLPEGSEFSFNGSFDILSSYYSKSMLVVPMKGHRGDVVGVLQLINRKRNFSQKLSIEQMKGEEVQPFDDYSAQLVLGVAGQAAVAIQNNYLLREIETLFEGFVTASVNAIEARDPTTSGHSFRVAQLTVGLAETLDRADFGKYKDLRFSKEQIKEIRYASLLHDFGKVGVREKVLVKAKKLEDLEVDLIDWRFRYLKKDFETKFAHRKVDYLKKHGTVGYVDFEKALEFEFFEECKRLNSMFQIISQSNEPSILEEANSQFLEEIAKMQYTTTEGESLDLISPYEFKFLTIKKGSLDFEERKEIESHVEHTFQFLSKIPWTNDLKMVPTIAHAHHEKLNGTGYPRGLAGEDIPIQSRIMTISDIFDALTDQDRPYKKAVPLERALDILEMEAKENHLDGDLLKVFKEAKIWEKLNHQGQIPK